MPLSVYLSIILIGTFLVIVFWGVITGFGNDADAIAKSPELPALALAHRVWGAGWIIILIAFLNSALAVQIACANVGTRMWYGMARSGSFPKQLAKVDPVRKTPINAILLEMVVNAAVGLYVGFVFGPDIGFFLMTGLILVLAVSYAYIFANVAVFRLYWTEYRSEFNWILHVVFPIVSSLVLLYAITSRSRWPRRSTWRRSSMGAGRGRNRDPARAPRTRPRGLAGQGRRVDRRGLARRRFRLICPRSRCQAGPRTASGQHAEGVKPWRSGSLARSPSSPVRRTESARQPPSGWLPRARSSAVNQPPTATRPVTLQQIKDAGGEGFAVVADMRDPAQVVAMVAEAARRGGRLDYVVSNAGINPFMKWDETTIEDCDELSETNLRGTWVVTTEGASRWSRKATAARSAAPARSRPTSARRPRSPTAPRRAASSMWAKAFGAVVGEHGIRVNAVEPGWIDDAHVDPDVRRSAGGEVLRGADRARSGRQPEEMAGQSPSC